jgi:hypothetical protein
MQIRAFITHKLSEKYKDCQDSYDFLEKTNSIAIADGISQSIFPKIWADLLTNNFVNNQNVSYLKEEDIDPLRSEWESYVEKVRLEKEQNNDPFLWKLEENLASGKSAGATFLGLRFSEKSWKCNVIGDSCLVEISEKNEISRIISSKGEGEEFDNHPDYIDSRKSNRAKGRIKIDQGNITGSKKLFLVTDALSDLLFKNQQENDFAIVEALLKIQTQKDFEDLVNDLRQQGMHNDDTTLVIVENDNKDIWTIPFKTDLECLVKEEKLNENKDQNSVSNKMFDIGAFQKIQISASPNSITEPNKLNLLGSSENITSVMTETTSSIDKENITKQISSILDSCESELAQIQILFIILKDRFTDYKKKNSELFKKIRNQAIKFLDKTKQNHV